MKKWLLFVCLIAVIGWWLHEPDADWAGLPAPAEPRQDVQNLPPPFKYGDYTITPLAHYGLQAVVLSFERYRNDESADLAPVDLALGWGPMSGAAAINSLSISQSARWYEYSWSSASLPIHPSEIALNSANTHCLPASTEVKKKLLKVRRHELVALSGYLVEVTSARNRRWRSSLSRGDTGGGACEVLWITALDSTPIPAK